MKKENFVALKWLNKNSKSVYFPILILTVIGILISVVSVRFALKSKEVLDATQSYGMDNTLKLKIVSLLVLVGIQIVFQAVYSILNAKITTKFSMNLKKNIFNSVLKKDYSAITKYHTGELLNRINNDVSVIVSAVMNIVPSTISLLVRIVLSFSTLFILDKNFAIVFLILGPIILIFTRLYSSKMKSLHKKCMESDGKTRSFMLECIQNLLVVKAYKNEEEITEKSKEHLTLNYKYTMKRNYISIIMNVMFYMVITVAYYGALAYCAYRVAKGEMTFGTLTAIIQLVGQVQLPFKDLAAVIPQFFSALASAERIIELENIDNHKSELCELSEAEDKIVEFKNVSFAYDKEVIIENADFSMKKGEFIAIGGLSGIGKSTFLKLVLGIIKPDCGEAVVYGDDKKRVFMAYVPQGNMILSGTIKENIAFYLPIDDEKIKEAARISDMLKFVSELPNGFDTVLGEKGLGLSEGQVQRIAIARAVYSEAPFLILDECTSALDEKTEEIVLKNLKNLENKSCIIVSHKKAALEICDKLLKIENKKPVLV